MKYHVMSFFYIFTVNLFAFNHLVTFSSSLFNVLINFKYSVPSRKTLVSSAKSIENNNVDEREKSFMNNIKSKGPRIEHRGTPDSTNFTSDVAPLQIT